MSRKFQDQAKLRPLARGAAVRKRLQVRQGDQGERIAVRLQGSGAVAPVQ
jgi:hypothetical protein